MRILHVTTVHPPLDTRIYHKEVRSLADSGFDVRLATTVDRAQVHDGIPLLPLGIASGSRWRRIARDMRAFVAMFANRNAIVHIHDPELLLVAALPAFLGTRVIYDVHEFYAERIAASAWIPRPLRAPAAWVYRFIERMVLPRFAGVVIVSEAMRPRYERLLPAERIALVQNFPNIDVGAVSRASTSHHPLEQRPYVLHTGGASRLRAFDDLVRATEYLREAGSDLTMVVLGHVDLSEYTPPERDDLVRRAADAGVRILGVCSYEETQAWLAHARVGYLPLADTDNNRFGMPNKLFEYAFFGLPVVAARLGRVAAIVAEHTLGLLASIGDGEAHGQAIMTLHTDRSLHDDYASHARAAGKTFSFQSESENLRALYARICVSTS